MKKSLLKFPLFQLFWIIITCLIIVLISRHYMSHIKIKDPQPHLYEFNSKTNELIKNSSEIEVGLYIQGFNRFDLLNDDFYMRGVVWFVFDPTKIESDLIKQFSFFRAEQMDVDVYDKQETKLSTNKSLVRYLIKVKFASNLDFSLYPFDDHRIYFILNNKFISLEKGHFTSNKNNLKFENDVELPGWNVINKGTLVGYSQFVLDNNDPNKTLKFPRVIFYMDFKNDNIKNIIIIFLPLFITFFMFTFFISTEYAKHQELITGFAAAAIPSILGYRFVIDSMSPKISYFTFADYIFALFITLSFICFLCNFYLNRMKNFRVYVVLIVYLVLIISWQYLFVTI